jgi:predicted MFS family arabinose efflux permease
VTTERTKDEAGVWITFREASVPVRAILIGIFINQLGTFFQTFLVLFLATRGFTEVQAGLALGFFGAGSVLGVLIGGALADRMGARMATLISMMGSAVLIVAVLYLRNYLALVVTVTLVGLVGRIYRPAAGALLLELTPKHQQVMISAMYRLAVNLGATAAPLLGVVLLKVSWSLLFWGEALAACGYAVVAAIALPRRKPADPAAKAAAKGRGGYGVLFRDHRYLLYLLAMLVNSAVYIQYISVLPLAITDAGLSEFWYGALVSLNGVIVITCELLITKVTQRWPIKLVVVTGFLLLGAGLSIYSLPLGIAAFITGTLIWTLAEIVGGPSMFAYPGRVAPEGQLGRYMGAMQAMFGVGAAAGPAVGVLVWQSVKTNIWWMYGLTCLLALAFAWIGMRDVEPLTKATDEAGAASDETTEEPA